MPEVPATTTPTSEYQASVYLVVALTNALQSAPSEQVATYSLALAWIETARGKSIVQNNPGNLSAGSSWSGNYWRPPWYASTEPKYAALHQQMIDGKQPSAFRAYSDPQEGWDAFAREVVRRKSLLEAMAADDPVAVVRALRETGYAQDYRDSVADSFRSLVAEFRSRNLFGGLAKQFDVEPPQSPTAKRMPGSGFGGVAVFLALLAAAGAGAAVLFGRKRR
jgi:hypothetical protein